MLKLSTTTVPVYTVTVKNPKGVQKSYIAEITGIDNGTGWSGDRSFSYRINIQDIIDGNGKYTININALEYWINGIALMIVYKDYSKTFQGHLVIDDGVNTYCEDSEYIMQGLNVCQATDDAKGFLLASDIQRNVPLKNSVNVNVDVEFIEGTINNETFIVYRNFWNFEIRDISLTQNQNSVNFILKPCEGIYEELYSWNLTGIYYRTENCFECTNNFDLQYQITSNEICPNETAEISLSVPEEYQNEIVSVTWTSIPPGFTSNEMTITVQPLQNTTYIVDGAIGNGCLIAHKEIVVIVNDAPKADAGPERNYCIGQETIQIGGTSTGGNPPYTFEWTPATGLSSASIENPIVDITNDTQYQLKVTDSKGCIGYDIVNVIAKLPPKPVIQVIGNPDICICDTAEIETIGTYAAYLWSNGETTKNIKVTSPGTYTVTVTDFNNCINTSDPVTITNYSPATTLALNDTLLIVQLGDRVTIPLKIRAEQHLDDCSLYDYTAVIKFNKTVLVPVDGTPAGVMDDMNRYITLSGKRIAGDTLLSSMILQAVLGNTDSATVSIESFEWTDCQSTNTYIDSAVKIIGLCYQGGTRLFDPTNTNYFLKQNYPNPYSEFTNIEFGILERGNAAIIISDVYGRVVKNVTLGNVFPGKYTIEMKSDDLAPGTYIYSLRINGQIINRLMSVSK